MVVKILLGLFIWLILPSLIYKRRKYKGNTPQYFVYIACKIVGIVIIVYAVMNLIKYLISI